MMKPLITLILLCLVLFPAIAQNKFAVGFQGGRSALVPETIGVPNQLPAFNAKGAGGVNMLVYGRYYFRPNWSARMGGGIIGYRAAHTHDQLGSITRTAFMGVQPQVMTGIDYHLFFGQNNFGVIFSAGLNANRAHLYDDRTITSEEGYPITAIVGLNASGSPGYIGILGHEVEYNYSTQKTLLHLRPEVTLFQQLGRHKLLACIVYGHALKESILTVDYRSISYSGEYYSARHRFSGSFTAIQLGYEFSF